MRGLSIIAGSTPYFSPLNINVYHQCHTATISANAGDTINYTILSGTQAGTLTSFTVNTPLSSCYSYSIVFSD